MKGEMQVRKNILLPDFELPSDRMREEKIGIEKARHLLKVVRVD